MKIILTESQIRKIIDEDEEITELRKSYLSYIVQKAEEITGQKWPDYVLKDWLYDTTKEREHFDVEAYLKSWIRIFGNGEWKLEKIKINIDTFEHKSKDELQRRMVDTNKNPFDIKNDQERFDKQDELIDEKPSEEPIIVVKIGEEYMLVEGWHRTITSLQKFEEFEQNAYVYYPKK